MVNVHLHSKRLYIYIYIYIYIYMFVCVCVCGGGVNVEPSIGFQTFFVQAFRIVVDYWKFSMLLLYNL